MWVQGLKYWNQNQGLLFPRVGSSRWLEWEARTDTVLWAARDGTSALVPALPGHSGSHFSMNLLKLPRGIQQGSPAFQHLHPLSSLRDLSLHPPGPHPSSPSPFSKAAASIPHSRVCSAAWRQAGAVLCLPPPSAGPQSRSAGPASCP